MNIEHFRDYCLSKPDTTEALPFDKNTLVFKVHDKIFALTDLESFESINLKCNPEWALELRTSYYAILPGYHMNKKHWNTILMDGSIPSPLLLEMIDHSYEAVLQKKNKKT